MQTTEKTIYFFYFFAQRFIFGHQALYTQAPAY